MKTENVKSFIKEHPIVKLVIYIIVGVGGLYAVSQILNVVTIFITAVKGVGIAYRA